MMKNYIFISLFSLLSIAIQAQTTFTEWNFDDQTANPVLGSGTITLIGGTTVTYASGNPSSGKAYNTSTYPAQSTASGTAGVEFAVSTVGKSNIGITFDHRSSGTGSRWAQYEYSTNGGSNWVIIGNNNGGLSPHDTFYPFTIDLTSCTACNNNADFRFKIVSIFSPVAFNTQGSSEVFGANEAYHRSREDGTNTSAYSSGGTWRFDNVKFISDFVMSTEENEFAQKEFVMYPNPAHTTVFFDEALTFTVYDYVGKKLMEGQNVSQVDITGWAKGIYFVVTDHGSTQKLMVE